jgi:homoserine dehydrogenase
VVADIVDVARSIVNDSNYLVPAMAFQRDAIQALAVTSQGDFVSAYYLRVEVRDIAGVMSKLATVFADLDISIEAIIQKEPPPLKEQVDSDAKVSVIFITQKTSEKFILQAIEKMQTMSEVDGDVVMIRVEHLD